MNLVPVALFSALLLLISAVLVTFDIRLYKRRCAAAEADTDRQTAWKRFRRRVQASGGIGLVGVLLLVGASINARAYPLASACIWIAAILATFWIAVIALIDLLGSRHQLAEVKRQQLIQTAILQSELRRAQEKLRERSETQVNGKHKANRDAAD